MLGAVVWFEAVEEGGTDALVDAAGGGGVEEDVGGHMNGVGVHLWGGAVSGKAFFLKRHPLILLLGFIAFFIIRCETCKLNYCKHWLIQILNRLY